MKKKFQLSTFNFSTFFNQLFSTLIFCHQLQPQLQLFFERNLELWYRQLLRWLSPSVTCKTLNWAPTIPMVQAALFGKQCLQHELVPAPTDIWIKVTIQNWMRYIWLEAISKSECLHIDVCSRYIEIIKIFKKINK